ncbi:MAG: hypothetical protein D4R68_02275 [Ignavibacteriales bacterium]|nr:MAG: hypothetical protein D4R68_02275 [Ignavibacteriales bacterium]
MFGLWFSIVGLIFGALCSFAAKEKNRAQKEWFTLGFIFSIIALGILYLLPSVGVDPVDTDFSNADDDISLSVTT